MDAIFLSASIPLPGRGQYFETSNPYLIQASVRAFLITVLGRRLVVWGGHPSITPMVWAVCEDLGLSYTESVVLYQSRYFQKFFPPENERFRNIEFVESVGNDLSASLDRMRMKMISRKDLTAGVFIGGMEGVRAEYDLFREYHPDATVISVRATGGAVLDLPSSDQQIGLSDSTLDFSRLFHLGLNLPIMKGR